MKFCVGIVDSDTQTSDQQHSKPKSTSSTISPRSTSSPSLPSSSFSHGISLTKDQALIILGMSSRMRTRIVDLDRRSVLENFRLKRRKTEERMTALTKLHSSSSSGFVSISLEQQIQDLKWEQIKVHAAAQHLLNALRVLDLTRDFSWKPGVPVSSNEDSRWTILVKPKGRSVSLLRKKSTRNAESEGSDKDTAK